jgi:enoyl-CoA hydratase/carnithine racemase
MRFDGIITVERQGAVLHAALSNPPDNALDVALLEALADLVRFFTRSDAKALVLSSGIPGAYATGIDVRQTQGVQAVADYRDRLCETLESLAMCPRPSIAVLDGTVTGGGLELAMACTLRFASASARLSLPEVKLGMIPSGGGTQRLPQLVGRGRALELMLSGREISGTEAERIGLVDRVLTPDVLEQALAIATTLAGFSAPAMAAIICCVDASRDLAHEDGLAVERVALGSTIEDGEASEGIAALVEDRPAIFG